MTKNHIIAKAMLTTLGLYAAFSFADSLRHSPSELEDPWILPMLVFATAVVIFYVVRILVFNNESLASKIIDQQDHTEDFDRAAYLIKAFRIGFVLLALLLLCSSGTIFAISVLLKGFSLPNIRLWITDVIETKRITGNLALTRYTGTYITGIVKLTAITYLLSGGKYIINWHLKNSYLKNTEGVNNE